MTDQPMFHENMAERDDVKLGSERSFGFVFAVVFAIVSAVPVVTADGGLADVRFWALGVAVAFAVVALVRPQVLRPLNKLWFRFGLLLHKVVNPLVMGLMFFVVVSPIGLLMRALGKTPLKTGFDPDAESYWIERDPPGPAPESMKRQF